VYTLCDGGTLFHYGWASGPGSEYYDEALKLYYRYPTEAVTLLDFFTHPSARGRGLYQDCLRYILADLHDHGSVQRAYIHVLNTNTPSKHVIEKVGFGYIGSILRRRTFGRLSVHDTLPPGYSYQFTA
jgi:RimJ/RimL family protein N-acetyltransferase